MATNYESVVQLHAGDAEEVIAMAREQGDAAAMAHLKKWHEPGEGTLLSTRGTPWQDKDHVYHDGQFTMYYDADEPFIALVCKVSLEAPK